MNFEELDKIECQVIEEDITNQDVLLKIIIIGDVAVGKSCIMMRAIRDEFKDEHEPTIGVEFGSYTLKIQDKIVKMQIWDTAGQEYFKSLTRVFYKGAHCVFIVYDIRREETFNKLRDWLNEVKMNSDPEIAMVLVGNQCDMESERKVTIEMAKNFCIQEKLDGLIETSAKSGKNVKELFQRTSKYLYKLKKNAKIGKTDGPTVKVSNDKNGRKETSQKKGCCK